MPVVVIQGGPLAGRRIEVDSELVIGRGQADLVIADAELSRRHVALRPAADGIEVEDLGSLNGTWVDDQRVEGRALAVQGSLIRAGASTLEVSLVTETDKTRVAAAPPAPVASPPPVSPAPVAPPPAVEPEPAPPPLVAPPRAPAPATPAGAVFAAPQARMRRRGPATRLWLPTAVTFATIAATAIALILYFVLR